MRKTENELLTMFPSWNTKKHNIFNVMYGDKPLEIKGVFYVYRTLIGEVITIKNEKVLCGKINVKFRGRIYNIYLNRMYGTDSLDIIRFGNFIAGCSNADGMGSASLKKNELSEESVEGVLNNKMEDYGIAIQKFMECVRDIYSKDKTNYFC